MHVDDRARQTRGRLSREDQRRLGDLLKRVYDDVIHEGVPDRFKILLDEIEGPQVGSAADPRQAEALAQSYRPSDGVIGAKSLDNRGSSE